MSIVDKALGAITPPESEEARAKANRKAREAATPGDWLSLALDHHDRIRSAFEACRGATDPAGRMQAMRRLALVLNGHSQAEETVLYPALAKSGEKGHATQAYTEQATAKMQMAELERIDPAGQAWSDKLEHIRGAVLHHMYEEEKSWFLELRQKYDDQALLTERFQQEFERYAGREDMASQGLGERRSFEAEGPTTGSLDLH
jgi:hypothetical protein